MAFQALKKSIEWHGHYERPFGKSSLFHVNQQNDIHIVEQNEWGVIHCYLAETPDILKLAQTVNECKMEFNWQAGGSFTIDEFGNVIVPLLRNAPRVVGYWEGEMTFLDLRKNPFSMSSPVNGLWPYPYLGCKYHLSYRNEIYMKLVSDEEERRVRCPYQDQELIRNLRRIRPHGEMSFLVNQYGVVLAKRESSDGDWPAYCAGKIDPDKWFFDPMTFEDNFDEVKDMIDDLEGHKWEDAGEQSLFYRLEYFYMLQRKSLDRWQSWLLCTLYNSVD